jgi:uncharacterized sulfatase
LSLVAVLAFCFFQFALADSSAADRPNIVLIISDDQTYSDFGFMGNRDVLTPRIDELAAKSARYVNGYVPSSVCRPSLVTLLTGLYPHQHGVHFNHPPPGFAAMTRDPAVTKARFDEMRRRATFLTRAAPSLPRILAKSGYRCLQTGKYWEGHWRNAGFTEGMTIAEPSPGAKNGNKTLASGDIVAHGNGDHGLAIGRETMKPIFDFIDECGETPFLVWYAPFLPHLPHDSPQRFLDRYADKPAIPKHRVPYYAAVSWFDETVGQLVDFVEKKGLAKNTIFVFVVDNGFVPDAEKPRREGAEFDYTKKSKRAPFDDGLRTPILIRWDGRTKPATHRELCSSVDILPTLLFATDQDIPQKLPGQSLWLSAIGGERPPVRPVFGEVYPGDARSLGNPSKDVAYRWIRDGNLKLIVPHSQNGKPPWGGYLKEPALFDVERNPDETRDLSNDPRYQSELRMLRKKLDDWWTPGDDSSVPKP